KMRPVQYSMLLPPLRLAMNSPSRLSNPMAAPSVHRESLRTARYLPSLKAGRSARPLSVGFGEVRSAGAGRVAPGAAGAALPCSAARSSGWKQQWALLGPAGSTAEGPRTVGSPTLLVAGSAYRFRYPAIASQQPMRTPPRRARRVA